MSRTTQGALSLRACIAAASLFITAGSAVSQIDTRDWLLPQSGLWSDPLNWSQADVPDTSLEVARLSPMPLGGLGTSQPVATVDGLYEILRLEGNGSVDVLISEGSELFISDGVIDGAAGGDFTISLGSGDTAVALPSALTMGDGAGRAVAVRNTAILMLGADSSPSIIQGNIDIEPTSSITGQGVIGRVSNAGEIVARAESGGSGVLVITDRLSSSGTVRVETTGELVLDGSTLSGSGDTFNTGLISVLEGTISGNTVHGGVIDWSGNCNLSNAELIGGNSNIDGTLNIVVQSGIFEGNRISLHSGSDIAFTDTVFLRGSTSTFDPKREIVFEPSETAPRLSAPSGESIIAMPGYTITGAGVIDANFLNFGAIRTNRGLSFDPVEETLEIRGEFTQTSSGAVFLNINAPSSGVVSDRILVTNGDADLDGPLSITVSANFPGNPFDQIALANQTVTLVRLESDSGVHSITGAFSSVSAVVLDDRLSPVPEVIYLPTRVDARFYCRADVNRDGAITPSDFSAWISAYQQGSPLADMTNNGLLNANDFTRWVELYNLGCED